MVGGKGGFLGSDLSGYGNGHSVDEIRQSIVKPGTDSVRSAVVTTQDGTRYQGLVRNEDNFSIQLQSQDGAYHFIDKADAKSVDYQAAPVMPSNYESTLTHAELNDIVSYLAKAAKTSKAEKPSADDE